MKNKYFILKPKKLDLNERVKRYAPKSKVSLDYCYYFISEIIRNTQKKNSGFITDFLNLTKKFAPMCASINQKFYRESKKNIHYLCENFFGLGTVLHRQNYEEGKCFSYRIAPYYWGDGELELACITEHRLLKNIQKIIRPTIRSSVQRHYKFLIKYFSSAKFEVDEVGAMNELYREYQKNGNYGKYLSNAVKVMNFKNGLYHMYCKRETDGRLHSALTQFPKICRKYLKYEGENLAETDLSSSIPFFLSFILSVPHSQDKQEFLAEVLSNSSLTTHYMLAESSAAPTQREVAEFKGLVLENKLYTEFMDKFMELESFSANFQNMFNREFDGDADDLRKYTKKRLLSYIFAHPSRFKEEASVFYGRFPGIHMFLKKLKKGKFAKRRLRDSHKKVSYIMFQLEVYFMVNLIAREINNKFKRKIPIFTLHDCLVCKESDAKAVYEQMSSIFIREMGFAPNLETKPW